MTEPTLAIEPIVAHRAWGLVTDKDNEPHLTPVTEPAHTSYRPSVWGGVEESAVPWATPGIWHEAECRFKQMPGTIHVRMSFGRHGKVHCHCGFWGVKDPNMPSMAGILSLVWDWNLETKQLARFVSGKVEMKGKVVEHEDGYRGQYARPVALYTTGRWDSIIERTAARYDIPVLPFPPKSKELLWIPPEQ